MNIKCPKIFPTYEYYISEYIIRYATNYLKRIHVSLSEKTKDTLI